MLKGHIEHGIQDVVVFANAIWVQAFRKQMVAVLGDVPMSQFIKIQISEQLCESVEVLIGVSLKLASVR